MPNPHQTKSWTPDPPLCILFGVSPVTEQPIWNRNLQALGLSSFFLTAKYIQIERDMARSGAFIVNHMQDSGLRILCDLLELTPPLRTRRDNVNGTHEPPTNQLWCGSESLTSLLIIKQPYIWMDALGEVLIGQISNQDNSSEKSLRGVLIRGVCERTH